MRGPRARPAPRVAGTAAAAGLLALGVFLVGLTGPSPWRDEVVSAQVADRGPAGVLAVVRHVDAVHATYYLLAGPWVGGEAGVMRLRLLSALALAGAVAGVALLAARLAGGRLAGPVAGAFAAALTIASPVASRYAQEARPYALVTLAAVVSTLLLVAAADDAARPAVRTGYGLSVVVLVLLNVLAGLLLVAHLAHLALVRGAGARRALRAQAVALAALVPFLLVALTQRGQVGWLRRPDTAALLSVPADLWGGLLPAAVALAVPLAALVLPAARAARPALVLALCWGWLPPLLLWVVSQWRPLFDLRYLVLCLPGGALAVALALVALARAAGTAGRRAAVAAGGVAVLALVVVAGLPGQQAVRGPNGHVDDVRGTAAAVAALAAPGEPVLYAPDHLRLVTLAYPPAAPLRDVALCVGGAASGTFTGVPCPPDVVAGRLAGARTVLLVEPADAPRDGTVRPARAILLAAGFAPQRSVLPPGGFRVTRWSRP